MGSDREFHRVASTRNNVGQRRCFVVWNADQDRWAIGATVWHGDHFDAQGAGSVTHVKRSVGSLQHARLVCQPFSRDELPLGNSCGNLARVIRRATCHSSFDHIRARSNRHGGHAAQSFGCARHFTVRPTVCGWIAARTGIVGSQELMPSRGWTERTRVHGLHNYLWRRPGSLAAASIFTFTSSGRRQTE